MNQVNLPWRSCQGKHESPHKGVGSGTCPDLAAKTREIQCGSEIDRDCGYDHGARNSCDFFFLLPPLFPFFSFFPLLPVLRDREERERRQRREKERERRGKDGWRSANFFYFSPVAFYSNLQSPVPRNWRDPFTTHNKQKWYVGSEEEISPVKSKTDMIKEV